MTTIQNVQTITPSATRLNPDDIARIPKSYTIPQSGPETDTYEPQSRNTLKKALIGTALAAAAIVGLKHCGFMKIEGEATTFVQKFIKKPINKLGEWIELPFVKIKNFFTKNADAIEEASEKSADVAPTVPKAAKGSLKLYLKHACRHPIKTLIHPIKTWKASKAIALAMS